MLFTSIRAIALTFAALLLLAAFAVTAAGVPSAALLPALAGGVIIVAVVLERTRYRSEAAERMGLDPGPGGGEDRTVDPRFRPTAEVFLDPTSGRLMRVWVDAGTGERRYVAER